MKGERLTIRGIIFRILNLGYAADEVSEDYVVTEKDVAAAVDLIERHPFASSVDDIPDHLLGS